MAKLLNGILGRGAGKISGVVMSHWKGISYARGYAIPANPSTEPQKAQRKKIRIGVALGKALVGQVLKPYWNKFARDMSGYNRWISENINVFTDPMSYSQVKMCVGQLWGVPTGSGSATNGSVIFSWTGSDIGNNGSSTDKVYAIAYSPVSRLYYFAAAPVARAMETIGIPVDVGEFGNILHIWAWAAKYSSTSPTLLELVSESKHVAQEYTWL